MIQANELRLGNLISVGHNLIPNKFETRVVEPAILVMLDGNFETKGIVFKSITLTIPILLELGFKCEDMADMGMLYYIEIGDGECLNFNNGTIWLNQYDTKVKYLHQLQNLYFALTGSEITKTP